MYTNNARKVHISEIQIVKSRPFLCLSTLENSFVFSQFLTTHGHKTTNTSLFIIIIVNKSKEKEREKEREFLVLVLVVEVVEKED